MLSLLIACIGKWNNCPKDLCGTYQCHAKEATIILKAVASNDLWTSHAFFIPSFHNDINVLQRSPVFGRLCSREAPPCNYTVNGHAYNMGYYLADGIYPQWTTFVKIISDPHGIKQIQFATMQETSRKNMERAFKCSKLIGEFLMELQ